ncbi:integrase core domain containing protein [Nitzschia inconspicua]|uniref:Integrase core domain containing protein n=1 Tax=Nitzschia inconspicua TaxID=303405 RepID=A0A9K3M7Q9_9STRA|nr:integrase core domain containing protein [Nitzschia inconspicua]
MRIGLGKTEGGEESILTRGEDTRFQTIPRRDWTVRRTIGGSKYAFSIVDDFTRKGWIKTAARKSQMTEFAKDVLKELKSLEYSTKFVRCDNAGENPTPLKKVCSDFGAQMELTAPYTPRMNGVVERRLPILVTRANAAMMTAGLNDEAKARLWGEAMNYQNDTENMTRDTPETLFYIKTPLN